eukprot:TRINITY_DN30832_c0_g1_i1.p1 TRINITY_DN30832_c0_g1~~TRINITY_DN30832_c0_g1_i1.p1  ORF type:complete len:441 (+),score=61.49 TRINITY_DN30832_c0_g1_i1:42-1325(+)
MGSTPITIDVLLRSDAGNHDNIEVAVKDLTVQMLTVVSPGKEIPFSHVKELRTGVHSIVISDTLEKEIPISEVGAVTVNVARVNVDSPFSEGTDSGNLFEEGETETSACEITPLPHANFLGLWESLHFDSNLVSQSSPGTPPDPNWCGPTKSRLMSYCRTALLFSDCGINQKLVTWNRVLLFHGPPGTGKTSLCQALAQKMSVMLVNRYPSSRLVEINTHSLFSKWFSESGKMVMKLFSRVREMAEDSTSLVFVLIDEVESLAAARQASLSSSEPSDSIRVVNALLTQLDSLKNFPNIVTLCTSNITEAIDLAFVDRADFKLYIGNPSGKARKSILVTALNEMLNKSLLTGFPLSGGEPQLQHISNLLEDTSGRFLRKLPFLAFARFGVIGTPIDTFLKHMEETANAESEQRQLLQNPNKKRPKIEE